MSSIISDSNCELSCLKRFEGIYVHPNTTSSGGNLFFLACICWYCLCTEHYAMDVYRRASASHFSSQCGNIHATQAKGAALTCSLWRSDELCMLKRCIALAEVDNGDISSSHKPSVIPCLVGWGGGRRKMVGCAPESSVYPFTLLLHPYWSFQIEILIDVI